MIKRSLRVLLPLVLSLFSHCAAQGQAHPAALGGAHIVAGPFISFYTPDYGPNRLWGPGAFIDLNLRKHWGAEGEVRFLRFNQDYAVHEDNYNLGFRYRWQFRRWEPYGKLLVGNGQINFPFSYGHGGYLLLAPGAGLDIHYHRFVIRAIDWEYQHWFDFQNSSLTPSGFSSGIAYRFY